MYGYVIFLWSSTRKHVFPLTCSVSTYTFFKGHILIRPLFLWKQVRVCDFLMELYKKTEQYVQHVHVAWWQDEQYRKCKDNFPIGTIISIVDFAENCTLQPHNEIQSQYYHSDQVNIMVHITYSHGLESNINNMIIQKETEFYISDDICHDMHYVQHCFQIFYYQLKEGYI